jgi:hypothetical protein
VLEDELLLTSSEELLNDELTSPLLLELTSSDELLNDGLTSPLLDELPAASTLDDDEPALLPL